jgi:hypothetical protein
MTGKNIPNKCLISIHPSIHTDCYIGARVVRTPNWQWSNQDGGDGCVGTLRAIHNTDVIVVWDTGTAANYRMCDLRVYDTAIAGMLGMFIYIYIYL